MQGCHHHSVPSASRPRAGVAGAGTASRARLGAFVRGPPPRRSPRFVWRAVPRRGPASCSFVPPARPRCSGCRARQGPGAAPRPLVPLSPSAFRPGGRRLRPTIVFDSPRGGLGSTGGKGTCFGGRRVALRGTAGETGSASSPCVNYAVYLLVSVQRLSPCRTWWSCGKQKKGNSCCPLR